MKDANKSKEQLINEVQSLKTKLKKLNKVFQEKEEINNIFFEKSLIPMFIVSMDDGSAVKVNERGIQFAGYRSKEDFCRNFSTQNHYAYPEDRQEVLSELKQKGEVYKKEYKFINKDRIPLWVEFCARKHPEKDWIVAEIVDITKRKELEMSLQKTSNELEEKVEFRTADLQRINEQLKREIVKRKEEEQKIINYQQQLKSLTSELILSEQNDRQHFADFLHDEVGQQLFATRLQLELLKNSVDSKENTQILDKALNNLTQIMNQTRSLTSEFSSPMLKQFGLEKALEWLAEQTYEKYGIMVTFEDDRQEKPIDENAKILLYQTVSELLANIAKHAQTKSAEVSIRKDNSKVCICVDDDGVGFSPPNEDFSNVKPGGMGLFRIKERLESLNGQFEIKSQSNHGTQVKLILPLENTT